MKVSLGLLPSGPDPVGEEHVRTNLPVGYMARVCGDGKMQPRPVFGRCFAVFVVGAPQMIARGSQDEVEVGRHIARWQGLIAHWNLMADGYRAAARGRAFATNSLLNEADATRQDILGALDLADQLIDNLAPGHDLRRDLFQIVAALECLSESIAISAEAMVPRIEASHNVAGLKYLLGALKKDAGLGV